MKIFISLIPAAVLSLSCMTMNVPESTPAGEVLASENRILNKRVTMLTRQNSICVEENLICRKNLDNKNAQYGKLKSDMDSMEKKLLGDISLLEGKNSNLLEKNAILEKESTEKLRELSTLAKQIEKKLGDEIAGLNAMIRKNSDDFSRQKEQLMLLISQKDFDHSKELEDRKKIISEKEGEIADLTGKNAELSLKLVQAVKAREEIDVRIKNLAGELESLRGVVAALEREKKEMLERLEQKSRAKPDETPLPKGGAGDVEGKAR